MAFTTIEIKTVELKKGEEIRIVRVGSVQEAHWRSEGFLAEGEEPVVEEKPVVKKTTTRRKKSEKTEVVTEEVTEN